jgi:predicted Zn-dependent peptidase
MLQPLIAGLVLFTLGAPVETRAEASIDDPALRVQRSTLPNGLTVLTLEDHATPVVSFQMWVRAGSRDESRYTGIAHLFEHMMFRGSKHIGPEEHARLINARGGRLNAYTSRDSTVYFEDVTAESLPLVIDLEAERLANLNISAEILDTEREVVLEERQLRTEDSPDGRVFEALAALVWTAHPYRWPVIGWRSDVEQVTVEACRQFFRSYYAPNNVVLVVLGDFETEPTLERIRQRFGPLHRAQEIPRNPTREPEQRGERRQTVYFDVHSPILAAAWHAPPSGHADAAPLDVASQILSAGRSSRLYRKLVYQEQQALYARGGYWELKDAGLFHAFAGVRPEASIDAVEELLFAEIRRLGDEGVTPEEVEKAKRQLEVALVRGLDTAHAVASRVGRDEVTFGRVRPLEELLAEIQQVTPEDVQRVVATYLVDEKRSVVRLVAPPAGSAAPETEPEGER